MSGIRLDLSNVQAANNDPLPVGEYRVQCVDAELLVNGKGNDQINLVMEVIEGDFLGRKFTHFMSLTESALPFVKAALIGMGISVEGVVEIGPDLFIGESSLVRLGLSSDKLWNRVQAWYCLD